MKNSNSIDFSIFGVYLSIFLLKRLLVISIVLGILVSVLRTPTEETRDFSPMETVLLLSIFLISQTIVLQRSYSTKKATPFSGFSLFDIVKCFVLSAFCGFISVARGTSFDNSFLFAKAVFSDSIILLILPYTVILTESNNDMKFVFARLKHISISFTISLFVALSFTSFSLCFCSFKLTLSSLLFFSIQRFILLSHLQYNGIKSFKVASIVNLTLGQETDFCSNRISTISTSINKAYTLPLFINTDKMTWKTETVNSDWDKFVALQLENKEYPWKILLKILREMKNEQANLSHVTLFYDIVSLKSIHFLSNIVKTKSKFFFSTVSTLQLSNILTYSIINLKRFHNELDKLLNHDNVGKVATVLEKRKLRLAFSDFQVVLSCSELTSNIIQKSINVDMNTTVSILKSCYIPVVFHTLGCLLYRIRSIQQDFFIKTIVSTELKIHLKRIYKSLRIEDKRLLLSDTIFTNPQIVMFLLNLLE